MELIMHTIRRPSISSEIAGVAARSVALLETIERTVTLLSGDTESLVFVANQAVATSSSIIESNVQHEIDPQGEIAVSLKDVCSKLEKDYEIAIQRRQSARNDPVLTPDDGVEDAYTLHIAALADLHNALENLRDAMEIHDARLSPVIGSFSNVDDLFVALESD